MDQITDLDRFQQMASRTGRSWDEMPFDEHRMLLAMGLGGETGEVLEIIKKEVGHGKPRDPGRVTDELGDLLWYVSELARVHGASLSDVATLNQDKLTRRYPAGFSVQTSLTRTDDPVGQVAKFLLDIGFGSDFLYTGEHRPPAEVLDRMIELMADDPGWFDQGEPRETRLDFAHWTLSDELGWDWR